ncbi:LPS O-antigen chain length determinant protein WzzB [Desulfocastanea catecholica]
MKSTQEQYQDDEIDLRELLTSLWANKLLIIAITVIFSLAGIAYALLAPQLWSAKAVVIPPLPSLSDQLQLRLENLVAISNRSSIIKSHDEFLAGFSDAKLFTDFIQAFASFDNKIEFYKTNGYVRQVDTQDVRSQQRLLAECAEKISVKQKKDEEDATLSFGSDNSQEAVKLLNEYLAFIQNKEVETKNRLLTEKIANQTSTLNFIYQVKKAETLKRLQEDIARTEYALRISKAAQVEAPVENLNNQSIFAIDLGAKALDEKLKILKEIKSAELINPELADIRLQLDSLQAIPQEKVAFTSYHFLQSPSEPLSRDKPKRPLVVILATMAGLMVGVMAALLRATSLFRGGKID